MLPQGKRLIEIGNTPYLPLIRDIIKMGSVMLTYELLCRYYLPPELKNKMFHFLIIFIILGFSAFHLVVDKLVGAGGNVTMCCPIPILGGGMKAAEEPPPPPEEEEFTPEERAMDHHSSVERQLKAPPPSSQYLAPPPPPPPPMGLGMGQVSSFY